MSYYTVEAAIYSDIDPSAPVWIGTVEVEARNKGEAIKTAISEVEEMVEFDPRIHPSVRVYGASKDYDEAYLSAGERRAIAKAPLLKLSYYEPDMDHELYRISYMDDLALIRRMDKIGSAQKLFNFYRALKKDRKLSLAKIVARKLEQQGYDTNGEPF